MILPDDGTAELGGNNRDEQIGALATNFQLFQRRYEADEETKFQRFKEQTKRVKLIHTAVSRGLSWKVTTAHPEKGKAVISSLREISCLHTIWAAYKYGNEDSKAVEKFTKDEMRPFKDKWTLQNNAILALKRLLAEGVDIHTACSRLEDVYHWGICGKASCFL